MTRISKGFRVAVLTVSFILLILVSFLDYLTGDELLFFVFYFGPVCLCAWHLTRLESLLMAVFCGVGWFLVDAATKHSYSHPAFRYWNALTCFVAFASIGVILNHLRRSLIEQSRARDELAKALENLQHSTEEIRKLQTNIQVVCAWTKKIKVDGKWIPLDDFLSSHLNVKVSHGMSPDALRIQLRNLEKHLSAGEDGP